MEKDLGWFIPAHARGHSISSYSLGPRDDWSSSFLRPLHAQPIFDYLSDPNPLHIDQRQFLLLKIQDPYGIEGLPFIHPSSQLIIFSVHSFVLGARGMAVSRGYRDFL